MEPAITHATLSIHFIPELTALWSLISGIKMQRKVIEAHQMGPVPCFAHLEDWDSWLALGVECVLHQRVSHRDVWGMWVCPIGVFKCVSRWESCLSTQVLRSVCFGVEVYLSMHLSVPYMWVYSYVLYVSMCVHTQICISMPHMCLYICTLPVPSVCKWVCPMVNWMCVLQVCQCESIPHMCVPCVSQIYSTYIWVCA